MAKNKISISFSKNNSDFYALVKSQENGSSYICNLIRKDMESYNDNSEFESKIEQTLEKLLKSKKLIYSNSDKVPKSNDNKPTDDEVDMILNLF